MPRINDVTDKLGGASTWTEDSAVLEHVSAEGIVEHISVLDPEKIVEHIAVLDPEGHPVETLCRIPVERPWNDDRLEGPPGTECSKCQDKLVELGIRRRSRRWVASSPAALDEFHWLESPERREIREHRQAEEARIRERRGRQERNARAAELRREKRAQRPPEPPAPGQYTLFEPPTVDADES